MFSVLIKVGHARYACVLITFSPHLYLYLNEHSGQISACYKVSKESTFEL